MNEKFATEVLTDFRLNSRRCLAVYFFGPEQRREPSDIKFEDETSGMTFEDEPEARALYEKMIEMMRKAESHLITLSTGREKWSSPNIRR